MVVVGLVVGGDAVPYSLQPRRSQPDLACVAKHYSSKRNLCHTSVGCPTCLWVLSVWQAMIPGLAGTLAQLQGDVQGWTAAVQQQTAAGQVQQAQGAAELALQGGLRTALSQPCLCAPR